jgi:hypothetical protein
MREIKSKHTPFYYFSVEYTLQYKTKNINFTYTKLGSYLNHTNLNKLPQPSIWIDRVQLNDILQQSSYDRYTGFPRNDAVGWSIRTFSAQQPIQGVSARDSGSD